MHPENPSATARGRETALAHGFWAGTGFVGWSLLASGVSTYFDASGLQTALCIVAGAALAAVSWNRAGAALDRIDAPSVQCGCSQC